MWGWDIIARERGWSKETEVLVKVAFVNLDFGPANECVPGTSSRH